VRPLAGPHWRAKGSLVALSATTGPSGAFPCLHGDEFEVARQTAAEAGARFGGARADETRVGHRRIAEALQIGAGLPQRLGREVARRGDGPGLRGPRLGHRGAARTAVP